MSNSIIIVDGHVHVHAGTDVGGMLDAAAHNFAAAATRVGTTHWHGVLLLAEMRSADWFGAIGSAPQRLGGWSLEPAVGDPLSIQAQSGDAVLWIVAGRQIVTCEGIEVLSLATRARIKDGLSLAETLQAADSAHAVIVLPWGAGKWLGERGRLVRQAIEANTVYPLFPGDNGGRPVFWPEPAIFGAARRRGRAVLPGTDPLPLSGEERRVGSFGFWLSGALTTASPGGELRERLAQADGAKVRVFGHLQSPLRFLRNQTALRMAKKRCPKN
jgi:hypothetical protein